MRWVDYAGPPSIPYMHAHTGQGVPAGHTARDGGADERERVKGGGCVVGGLDVWWIGGLRKVYT